MAPGSAIGIRGAARLDLAPGEAAPTQLPPQRLGRMDRLCRLALVACERALADANLPALDGDRTAVVFGTVYGCHATNEDYERSRATGASPRLFSYTLPSSPVGEISIHYRLRGPALTFASGATAALDALGAALRLLRDGRAERVLVVSADVATPWLARVAPTAPARDTASALVLTREDDAPAATAATPRARVVAARSGFCGGDPAQALDELVRGLDAASAGRLTDEGGPLAAIAAWLPHARGSAVVTATDEAGAAAAALLIAHA